jgi:hypothetical protein
MWLALGMDALGFLPQIVIDPGSPTRPPPLFPIRLIDQVPDKWAFCMTGRPMKNLMISALRRSMKKAPTRGITRKALKEGPYFAVIAFMLAIATGVAPRPRPVNPAQITAASYVLPMMRKTMKAEKKLIKRI